MKPFRLITPILLFAVLASCEPAGDEEGTKKASSPVKVSSITLNATTKTLAPKGEFQLEVTEVSPANATDKSVTWGSDNHTVVGVDTQTGRVYVQPDAPDGSKATITAYALDESGKTASCRITVAHIKMTDFSLNKTTLAIHPGNEDQLIVTDVLPEDATDQSVTWSSSNHAAATVDNEGKVFVPATAVDAASATITATANDGSGKTASCRITVTYVRITDITLNYTENVLIPIGGSRQLSVISYLPSHATTSEFQWGSFNTNVATVDQTGKVTIPAGATTGRTTVVITATAKDRDAKTARCTVTAVYVPPEGELIGDLVWAKYNVDGFGSFAGSPQSPGKFYQWNRSTAWPTTGEVSNWNVSPPEGPTSWSSANDPCPAGWRLPGMEDWAFTGASQVTTQWTTIGGREGRKYTDGFSGGSIFFPIVGYRYADGTLMKDGSQGVLDGYYWMSYAGGYAGGTIWDYEAWAMRFFDGGGNGSQLSWPDRRHGLLLRCVLKDKNE